METNISLDDVREQLKRDGFSGLYCDGECGCTLDDLAPCGMSEREEGETYINGCEGGYKHDDPSRPNFWVISWKKQPPSQEDFDRSYHAFG